MSEEIVEDVLVESDEDEIAKLLGSSGKLMDAARDFALAYINAHTEESLPANPDGAMEAVRLYVLGLQNPESDLFVDAK